jgi:hypothetical protein
MAPATMEPGDAPRDVLMNWSSGSHDKRATTAWLAHGDR